MMPANSNTRRVRQHNSRSHFSGEDLKRALNDPGHPVHDYLDKLAEKKIRAAGGAEGGVDEDEEGYGYEEVEEEEEQEEEEALEGEEFEDAGMDDGALGAEAAELLARASSASLQRGPRSLPAHAAQGGGRAPLHLPHISRRTGSLHSPGHDVPADGLISRARKPRGGAEVGVEAYGVRMLDDLPYPSARAAAPRQSRGGSANEYDPPEHRLAHRYEGGGYISSRGRGASPRRRSRSLSPPPYPAHRRPRASPPPSRDRDRYGEAYVRSQARSRSRSRSGERVGSRERDGGHHQRVYYGGSREQRWERERERERQRRWEGEDWAREQGRGVRPGPLGHRSDKRQDGGRGLRGAYGTQEEQRGSGRDDGRGSSGARAHTSGRVPPSGTGTEYPDPREFDLPAPSGLSRQEVKDVDNMRVVHIVVAIEDVLQQQAGHRVVLPLAQLQVWYSAGGAPSARRGRW